MIWSWVILIDFFEEDSSCSLPDLSAQSAAPVVGPVMVAMILVLMILWRSLRSFRKSVPEYHTKSDALQGEQIILFYFILLKKKRSVAFQPCITLGGIHLVKMCQKNYFLHWTGLKTLILAAAVLDRPTSEWAILKISLTSTGILKTLEHQLRNVEDVNLLYCPIGGRLNFSSVWQRKNVKKNCSLNAHSSKFAQREKYPG